MDSVKVNTNMLQYDVSSMKSEIESISGEIDKMYENIVRLGNMWKGSANNAFNQSFSKDYDEMKEFVNALNKDVLRIEDERKAYDSCENNVINLAQSV